MLSNLLSFGGEYSVKPENIIYASFDLCALVLGVIVLVNYAVSKKIDTKINRLFLTLAVSAVVCAALDFVAVLALSVTGCPVWLGNLLVSINYLAYGVTGLLFVVYAVSVIYENSAIPKVCYAVAYALFYTAVGGVIFATVCLFKYGYNGVSLKLKLSYEGIIYGCQFISLAFALVLSIVKRARLTKVVRFNIYFFCLFNIFAIAVQYFVRRMQLSDFALVIAILLIYVTLQRPEDEIDAVSGAFNAHTFNRRGNMRISENRTFWVFITEINNMTVVNSSFGLNSGNQVIREVADRLKSRLKKGQYLYRLSGVRFAVIFDEEKKYEEFAVNCKGILDEPVKVAETEIKLTAIACVIKFPDVTNKLSEVEDLVRYYRNSVNVSEDIIVADVSAIEKARRRELVDFAIQNAINNASFEVYYQPIYCVKDKAFSGCEALIRLKDEKLGFISPDE